MSPPQVAGMLTAMLIASDVAAAFRIPSRSADRCFQGAKSTRSGNRWGKLQPLPIVSSANNPYGINSAKTPSPERIATDRPRADRSRWTRSSVIPLSPAEHEGQQHANENKINGRQ